MLSYLPWKVFDELVAAHGADKWVRTLSTKWRFVALLPGPAPAGDHVRQDSADGIASLAARGSVPGRIAGPRRT
jgi:hypothetical protein